MPSTETTPTGTVPYPWQQASWQRLTCDLARLPHAILINGLRGLGKHHFARELAMLLLCQRPKATEQACGVCKSCRLLQAGNHPDLVPVEPLEEGKAIVVDQIRELQNFLALRPHTAPRKVVILSPAEAMTTQAANSLLKQLEEPPPDSVLLLVSHQPQRLPATVRSRCSRIDCKPPAQQSGVEWLTARGMASDQAQSLLGAAGGAPVLAEALATENFLSTREQLLQDVQSLSRRGSNPVACATRWKQTGSDTCLAWFQGFIAGLIKTITKASPQPLANADVTATLQTLAGTLSAKPLFELLDAIGDARRLLSTGLDELLLLEDILIRWSKIK